MPRPLGRRRVAKVDFGNVEEVLLQVAKARNMVKLTFDHWNAEATIQSLWRQNVQASTVHFGATLQKEIYANFRTRLNQGLVKFPAHPTLLEELENLELHNGNAVKHPKNKDSKIPGRGKISKDLADVVAMVDYHISKQERDFNRNDPNSMVSGYGMGGIQTLGQSRHSRDPGVGEHHKRPFGR